MAYMGQEGHEHHEDPSDIKREADLEFELLKIKMKDQGLPPLDRIHEVMHDSELWMMRNDLMGWARKFEDKHKSDLGHKFIEGLLKQIDDRLRVFAEK